MFIPVLKDLHQQPTHLAMMKRSPTISKQSKGKSCSLAQKSV